MTKKSFRQMNSLRWKKVGNDQAKAQSEKNPLATAKTEVGKTKLKAAFWGYSVYPCPIKGTPGLNGLNFKMCTFIQVFSKQVQVSMTKL